MPSFSRSLEKALHQALALAGERHQEYATLEHLLLALIEDQDAAAVMRACNVDLDVLRRSLVDEVGRFRPGFDGSQDYDLILRVTERARHIHHIPRTLYHWRRIATSVAACEQ